MHSDLFQPTIEGEARLLLLIEAFSRGSKLLDGRTKLAKLDFFLRYPSFLKRALAIVGKSAEVSARLSDPADIESRMVRYRFGPWDPSYFAILGRLIGKGLIVCVPTKGGIGYKVTPLGKEISDRLKSEAIWEDAILSIEVLRQHFDRSGTYLKEFIYKNFPEVAEAHWGTML